MNGGLRGELVTATVPPSSIPLASGWTPERVAELRGQDGLEITARVGPGKGSNGYYGPSALKRFHEKIQAETLAGYRGHLKPEDFSYAMPNPAIHWIGSRFDEQTGELFARGVVDEDARDIKRLLRNDRLDSVSIFYGDARRDRVGGVSTIVDLEPLSIDLVPLGRQGMPEAAIVGKESQDQGDQGDVPMGDQRPSIAERVGELRAERATLGEIATGMGWQASDLLPLLPKTLGELGPLVDRDAWDILQSSLQAYGELRDVLGMSDRDSGAQTVERAKAVMLELATVRGEARKLEAEAAIDRASIPEQARGVFRSELHRVAGDQMPADAQGWDQLVGELARSDVWRPLLEMTPYPASPSIVSRSPERAGSGARNIEWDWRPAVSG